MIFRLRLTSRAGATRLGVPVTLSAILHGSLVLVILLGARQRNEVTAPIYRVELVAAPRGPRAVGVVTETAPPAKETSPTPPRRPDAPPKTTPSLKKAPAPKRAPVSKATPTPDARSTRKDDAPKAGGGPEGGKGADVANVSTPGVEFPYPAYLNNIVRQIALRFRPRAGQVLSADVVFLIRRDGSVAEIQLRRSSGSFGFDSEAKGAVEAAANARVFGPLPEGYSDDVLTVIFSFDPRLIR